MAPHNRERDRGRENRDRDRGKDREHKELEQQDVYVGPEEFMQAGWRGFLVTTLARKEEFGVDDALDLLRQASIKIHGGYKPHGENTRRLEHQGYVKVDFMDLEKVTIHPNPNTKEEEEARTASGPQHDEGDEADEKDHDDKMGDGDEEKPQEEENQDGEDAEKKGDGEAEKEEEKKKGGDDKEKKEKEKKERRREREKDEKKEHKEPERMHAIYKFKAYRTEIRNRMFILSDVPDPTELAQAAMDLVIERNKVTGDAVNQLLPVVGICHYDYLQLEIMCKRVLASIFDEQQEPKCFDVMMIDKLSDPGSDMLIEIVRNAVWAMNPLAWLSSPVCEPDVVLRLEVLGSKLVLSAITEIMKYRQFSPTLLVDLGTGQGEDDDGGWNGEEAKKESELHKKLVEKKQALEKQRDEERQKERAKRHAEAEERSKKREEERRKERKKKEEKDKEVDEKKAEEMKKKATDWIETRKKELTEKSKGEEKAEEKIKKETPTEKETPPAKKQKINTGADDTPKESEVKIEVKQDEPKSTPAKSRRSARKK